MQQEVSENTGIKIPYGDDLIKERLELGMERLSEAFERKSFEIGDERFDGLFIKAGLFLTGGGQAPDMPVADGGDLFKLLKVFVNEMESGNCLRQKGDSEGYLRRLELLLLMVSVFKDMYPEGEETLFTSVKNGIYAYVYEQLEDEIFSKCRGMYSSGSLFDIVKAERAADDGRYDAAFFFDGHMATRYIECEEAAFKLLTVPANAEELFIPLYDEAEKDHFDKKQQEYLAGLRKRSLELIRKYRRQG